MGTTVKNLSRLLDFNDRGLLPAEAAILDLGAQQLSLGSNVEFLRDFIARFAERDPRLRPAADYRKHELARLCDGGFTGELLTACGFEYRALDLIHGHSTILFDLNLHQPSKDLVGKFALVTNFGTTEHLINQYLAMKTMHDLTKLGGIIYHDVPMSGYYEHGYFSYTPCFFRDLAAANRYEIVLQAYAKTETPVIAPAFMREAGFPDPAFNDFGIEFGLRKTTDEPFRMPLDPATSLSFDHAVWNTDEANASGYSPAQATALERRSGWELQRELLSRYRKRVARWFAR
jgi:hypothetical protein